MFDMMNVEIVKDFRNKANRAANCETANIERTVKASWEQSAAIEKIEEKKGLDFLGVEFLGHFITAEGKLAQVP